LGTFENRAAALLPKFRRFPSVLSLCLLGNTKGVGPVRTSLLWLALMANQSHSQVTTDTRLTASFPGHSA